MSDMEKAAIARSGSPAASQHDIFTNSEKAERSGEGAERGGKEDVLKRNSSSDAGEESEVTLEVQSDSDDGAENPWKKFHDEIPDGGLVAWLQVAGAFFLFFNSWGIINSFGVYQTYYQAHILQNYDPSAISWIGSTQSFLLLVVGSVSGRFADAGYVRASLVVGALFIVLGLMLTSLSTEYYQIFLAQGILTGAGGGLAFTPGATAATHWFKKRRAFATGIAAAGSSIGGVIYPITLRHLIDKVGFPWAVRCCGFIALATLLFSITVVRSRAPPRKLSDGAIFEFSAFKEVTYALFALGCFLGFMGVYVPFFYIGTYAKSQGVDDEMAFYLVSIANAASTFGRILPNLLADKWGPYNMFVPCAGISSILIIVLQSVKNKTGFIIYAVAYGFISGSFVSLPPVVVASITKDFSRLGSRLGVAFAFCSFSVLTGPPISGAIITQQGGQFWGAFTYAGVVGITGVAFVAASRASKTGMNWLVKA